MRNKLAYIAYIVIPLTFFNISHAQTPIIANDGGHEQWEFILEGTGDVLQIALPIGAGMITLIKGDYEGTKQLVFSYGTTLALTYSLKYLIAKRRPEGRHQYDAFPSGHTASAFSGASFIQRRYGWEYGWAAYVLAGIVAVSRVEGPDGYHDYWDVLAGATVGLSSTYMFTSKYQDPPLDISFASGSGNYVLTIKYQF
ncbi:MAG: phosphatase PAP2 family protein [Bacteroidia bacterium]|nr:phosphatase PAP2 family protein [Bacteroidia bacterium]NNF30475.1 phosphatase PAP2 family protein [Flavobacteriaceae bacterium]MBT8276159.1 phosphatase PAP2 family protein [Bacteroidia bacterium]NNJ81972.1 phosphatase PAP2 family protein [Flavobacteriaceae bacterium]NNK52934.1 phosphatase PAP2 family protein [Flavobacteriaceae bacterium]